MNNVKYRYSILLRVIAIIAGLICAFVTTFIGVLAVPFTGYGFGLASFANHYLTISLGIELPLYVALIFISRRLLAYACFGMSAINYIGVFLLGMSDIRGPVHATALFKLLAVSVFFPGEISCIMVALTALYLSKDPVFGRPKVNLHA